MCASGEFDPVGDRKHIKETCGTVQKDGFNDALIEQQQKEEVESFKSADGWQSLFATFKDARGGELIKGEFIVQSCSRIFESVRCLNSLGLYEGGLLG